MGIASGGKTAASINVTPMIDILLVLLITFMLIQTRSEGLPSEVPEPGPDPAPQLPDRLDATLRIRKDRSMEIDSRPVLVTQLDGRLKALSASRPEAVLFIDGAPELQYADVASVIDAARGAGWKRVGLLTKATGP
jgi:biopolymer transport protein TolR